jgi:integrative and conjugative element protein (TIGR02256 family)
VRVLRRRGLTPPRCVWVAREALCAMEREAREKAPRETGGMLLGYRAGRSDAPELVVETVIGPGPRARHGRTRFDPDGAWQRVELARAYRSRAATTYLGDWHSHPGGTAAPSDLDRRTARAIARRRRARAPQPLMAILFGGRPWELAAWCWWEDELHRLPARLYGAREAP